MCCSEAAVGTQKRILKNKRIIKNMAPNRAGKKSYKTVLKKLIWAGIDNKSLNFTNVDSKIII